jgi:arsenate reductase (glutaredoxin)
MIVYGIKNCNTVKKALVWLKDNEIAYEFHDYKLKGISGAVLSAWCHQAGWENLVNKRGTTWKQLDERVRDRVTSEKQAIVLMAEKTSVIRRPIIEKAGKILVLGFDEEVYRKKFL